MSPQPSVAEGEKVALASPRQLLPLLPPVEDMHEVSAGGKESTTVTWVSTPPQSLEPHVAEIVTEDGADFASWLPHSGVAPVGDHAVFQPQGDDPAYAVYRLFLSDYNGASTLKFIWEQAPADLTNLWTGFANFNENTWDWYQGPDDFVLTVPSYEPYIDEDSGTALVAVAVLGTGSAMLRGLAVGASELRGSGAEPVNKLDFLFELEIPPVPVETGEGAEPLPESVDLSAGTSPINDQKWWNSCTAFAVGDGAFNYELNRLYSDYGWNLNDAFNRVSPKYLYIVSGELQGWEPGPEYGRYTMEVISDLVDHGVATEQNAPYDLMYNNDWSEEALADAELLTIEEWERVPVRDMFELREVKAILAFQRVPVIMRLEMDRSFLSYHAGKVWNYSGPSVGGHAMLVVGYDDVLQAFKVRNSWGKFWGDRGYIWIGYDTFVNRFAYVRLWIIQDEYDPAVVERFLGPETLLPAPTDLQASDGAYEDRILLTWTMSEGASGYLVSRGDPDYVVAEVGRIGYWFDDSVYSNVDYAYWVKAVDGERVSYPSESDTGYAE